MGSSNAIACTALFFAITGSAVALEGRNTVDSGDIRNGEVRTPDIRDEAVSSAAVADDSLTGADIVEGTLTGLEGPRGEQGPAGPMGPEGPAGPMGPAGPAGNSSGRAGGDLAGTYPNPTLANGAVAGGSGGEIKDDSITRHDVLNQSLTGSDIEDNTVNSDDAFGLRGTDVSDDSLSGADIDESSLNVQQDVRWALVTDNSITAQSGGISLASHPYQGGYVLGFGSDLRNFAIQITGNDWLTLDSIAFICGDSAVGGGGATCPTEADTTGHLQVLTFDGGGRLSDGSFWVSAIPR